MKVTVDLPDDLAHEMKSRAFVLGITIKELVADLLQQGLGLPSRGLPEGMPASSLVRIDEGGLPVVPCWPGAPAARMRVQELLRFEQKT